MKHTIRQVFHSGKFVVGFSIFMALLLIVIVYPLIMTNDPLEIIAQGTFFPPGIYANVYDSIDSTRYILNLDDAAAKRIDNKLGSQERQDMKDWLLAFGIPENEIDITNTKILMEMWDKNYDPKKSFKGMTFAKQRYYQRLDASIDGVLSTEGEILAVKNPLEPVARGTEGYQYKAE